MGLPGVLQINLKKKNNKFTMNLMNILLRFSVKNLGDILSQNNLKLLFFYSTTKLNAFSVQMTCRATVSL